MGGTSEPRTMAVVVLRCAAMAGNPVMEALAFPLADNAMSVIAIAVVPPNRTGLLARGLVEPTHGAATTCRECPASAAAADCHGAEPAVSPRLVGRRAVRPAPPS